jgi:hypothetical protein
VEVLEDRTVPTVTASLNATTGLLSLAGDTAAHNIVITEQSTPGTYQVTALDLASGPSQILTGVSALSLDTGAGNTTVTLVGNAAASTTLTGDLTITGTGALTVNIQNNVNVAGNFTLTHSGSEALSLDVQGAGTTLGNVTVSDGIGNSTVTLEDGAHVNGALMLNLGAGDNQVILQPGNGPGAFVQGGLTMTGGTGNDILQITGSTVHGDVSANLGDGVNDVAISDGTLGGQLSFASAGQDEAFTIQKGSVVVGNVSFTKTGGTGSSSTQVLGSVIGGTLAVTSGAGSDSVTVAGSTTGALDLHLSGGANSVTLDHATVLGNVADFGSGQETVTVNNGTKVYGNMSVNAGAVGSINAAVTGSTITGSLFVGGGAGDDSVDIAQTSVGTNLGMNLGTGTDKATLLNDKVGGGVVSKGTGVETLNVAASQIQGSLSVQDQGASSVAVAVMNAAIKDFLSVISGPGNATVTVTGTSVGRNLGLALGGTSDSVALTNVRVSGNLFGSAAGDETFVLQSSDVLGYVSLKGGSSSALNVAIHNNTIDQFLSIINASGTTAVDVTSTSVGENFGLALGGSNSVTIAGVTVAGDLFELGEGTETLTVNNTAVAGGFNFNSSTGVAGASVSLQGDLISGDLGLDTGNAPANLLIQDTTIAGPTAIDTHNGNALVATNSATFEGDVVVNMGVGADTLNVQAGPSASGGNTLFLGSVSVSMAGATAEVNLGQGPANEALFFGQASFVVPQPSDVNQAAATFLNGAPTITGPV